MKLDEVEQHEWIIQQAEASNYFISPPGWVNVKLLKDTLGVAYDTIVSSGKDSYAHFCYLKKDCVRLSGWILEQETKNPGWFKGLMDDWKETDARYHEACESIPELSKLSDAELVREYNTWMDAYTKQWAVPLLMDAWNLHAEELLIQKLRPLLAQQGKELTKYLPVLTAPVDNSWAAKEEEELFVILSEIDRKNLTKETALERAGEQLKKHAENYHWIHNSYIGPKNLDASYFAQRLVEISERNPEEELERIRNGPLRAKRLKEKHITELNLDEDIQRMLTLTEYVAIWQDTRKKNMLIGVYCMEPFLNELCRRKGWKREEALGITFQHYEDALNGKIPLEKIRAWGKESLIIWEYDEIEIHTGNTSIFFDKLQKSRSEISDIKGTCASQGRAEGTVRIIRQSKDIPKMQKGDILVSGMTRPEIVPAMKLAAAIVTDEGGMTSHAAIVSRELGIPCIVGTHSATKLLKDGDFVEVNADHGAVRKVHT